MITEMMLRNGRFHRNREGVRCRLIFQFRPDGGQERFGKFAEVGVHSALDTSQKNQISDDEQYHENER